MTTQTDSTASVVLKDALTAAIGDFLPKPTSLSEGQVEASSSIWTSGDQKNDAGIWEASPGTFTARRDGYHEICQILSGRATIEATGEEPFEIAAGDTFVMPAGWTGTWHVHETMRKVYVTITL